MMKKMNSIAAFLLSTAMIASTMSVCAFADESTAEAAAATGIHTVYGVVTAVDGENVTIALAPTRKDAKEAKKEPKKEAEKSAESEESEQTESKDAKKAPAPMQKGARPEGKNAPGMKAPGKEMPNHPGMPGKEAPKMAKHPDAVAKATPKAEESEKAETEAPDAVAEATPKAEEPEKVETEAAEAPDAVAEATPKKAEKPEKPEAPEAETLTFQLTDRTEIIRSKKNVLTTVEKDEIAEHAVLRVTLDGEEALSVQVERTAKKAEKEQQGHAPRKNQKAPQFKPFGQQKGNGGCGCQQSAPQMPQQGQRPSGMNASHGGFAPRMPQNGMKVYAFVK